MPIKDDLTRLGKAQGVRADIYLSRALNEHGMAALADCLDCSCQSLRGICDDWNIRWRFIAMPPDAVIIVRRPNGETYRTAGRPYKDDPPR